MTTSASTLGISSDHRALHEMARAFLQNRCPPAVPRAYLDDAADHLPPFWDELAELGWFGIHLPERFGGGGAGPAELAIVLEELGRVVAPGPLLPTVLAAAVIDRLGDDAQRAALLPDLASGTTPAAVAFGAEPGTLDDGTLHGSWPLVPSAGLAAIVLVPARRNGGQLAWCVVDRNNLTITPRPSVDATRPLADVTADAVLLPPDRVLTTTPAASGTDAASEPSSIDPPMHVLAAPGPATEDGLAGPDDGEAAAASTSADGPGRGQAGATDGGMVERLAVRLLAAEAVGVAGWCVAAAAAHAQVREQFGRPIGQFQAVKHRCADMLCAAELARAAAWDAARDDDPVADVAAGALAPEAALRAAEGCIQVHGGIGFTWEHDAHLYLKRALAIRSLVGTPGRWRAGAVEHARQGRRRRLGVDLPPEADAHRAEVRAFLVELKQHPTSEWRVRMADAGYLAVHSPRPWGRGASALEQLVIDEEFAAAEVRRPHLAIAGWILPTIIGHGTDEQQARWAPPTLQGSLTWCQLFSEPGAGSDLASLSTKASRVEGGWLLTGQKVWTTFAHQADLGLCLARTSPAGEVGKHDGITCFVVDMKAEGIDVRPLRELTGVAMFNEVFLTDVFVPDDDVVGPAGGGWRAARTTLGNERVSMSSGSSFGLGEEALLALLDGDHDDEVGRLLIEAQALAVMGLRMTLRAIEDSGSASAAEPGPEASVRKLLVAEHDQKVQETGWSLLGRAGGATDAAASSWVGGYLANRCLTIAGGTSEIQRNVIAERLLGLPRDAAAG